MKIVLEHQQFSWEDCEAVKRAVDELNSAIRSSDLYEEHSDSSENEVYGGIESTFARLLLGAVPGEGYDPEIAVHLLAAAIEHIRMVISVAQIENTLPAEVHDLDRAWVVQTIKDML